GATARLAEHPVVARILPDDGAASVPGAGAERADEESVSRTDRRGSPAAHPRARGGRRGPVLRGEPGAGGLTQRGAGGRYRGATVGPDRPRAQRRLPRPHVQSSVRQLSRGDVHRSKVTVAERRSFLVVLTPCPPLRSAERGDDDASSGEVSRSAENVLHAEGHAGKPERGDGLAGSRFRGGSPAPCLSPHPLSPSPRCGEGGRSLLELFNLLTARELGPKFVPRSVPYALGGKQHMNNEHKERSRSLRAMDARPAPAGT